MQKKLLATLTLCLLPLPVFAVEDLILTTPETKPSATKWRLNSLSFDRSAPSISFTFLEPTTGETKTCTETGVAATTIISNLNTADFRTNSLQRRAITRAQTVGCIGAGTVSGTPD